jgi:hypothetical protein
MKRTTNAAVALLVGAALFHCAAALAQVSLADGFSNIAPGSRIVLMPLDVELFEISMGGVPEPRADWTADAARFLLEGIRERKMKLGAHVTELTDADDEAVTGLTRLYAAVSRAVVVHHYGPLKLPTKEGKLDWTVGPDAAIVQQRTGADYALFTRVRDHYNSEARQATVAITTVLSLGRAPISVGLQQIDVSLVELRSGRIVWFNYISRGGKGDLRSQEAAQETLDLLLAGFPS